MKCKAACSGLSEALIAALNGLRLSILNGVIGPNLKRPNLSSAAFYVQKCDEADAATHEPFCEVRLSGVSVTDDRSVQDFEDARKALAAVYYRAIKSHLQPGQEVSLFVVLMLDGAPRLGKSPLVEGEEIKVRGE